MKLKLRKSPSLPVVIATFGAVLFLAGAFLLPYFFRTVYTRGADGTLIATMNPQLVSEEEKQEEVDYGSAGHVPTPKHLKGIYMSQCAVGTPSFQKAFIEMLDTTELNTVMIDIKDYTGTIAIPTDDPTFADISITECGNHNMEEFIAQLHAKNIYVIGRITVFQDPTYTDAHPEQAVQSKSRPGEPWVDRKGLAFVDVSSQPFWDYIVKLSKISYGMGFDELNYDYIRYPSDGVMSDAVYKNPNKAEAVEKFWKYLHAEMKPTGVVMSADLFGLAAVNYDDLGIGQVLERALPYFDYIMPMVYPSHFADGFNGIADPNTDVYTIIKYSMDKAVARTIATQSPVQTLDSEPIMKEEVVFATETSATTTRKVPSGMYTKEAYPASKIRPWLQDFDYPVDYTPAMVRDQIKGTTDAGLTQWIFWDPGNKYSSLKQVIAPE